MPKKPEAVVESFEKSIYAPVYFLCGDEPFFIDEITSHLEGKLLAEAEKSFNQTVFYGRDVSIAQVLEAAKQFPFMGDRRLVLIKEAQDLADFRRDKGKSLLEEYIKNPVPSSVVCFAYKKKLDSRTKFFSALDKYAVLVNSIKIYNNQVPQWVSKYARQKKLQITDKATFLLSEHIGNDLSRVSRELDKIKLAIGEQLIDDKVIEQQVGISKDYNLFELQDAIAIRDKEKGFKIISFLANNSKANPIIPVIGFLYSFFSKLLIVSQSNLVDKSALARKLGVRDFALKSYLIANQNYKLDQLKYILRALLEADLAIKGINASLKEKEILKELFFKVFIK